MKEFLLVVVFYLNGPNQPPVFMEGFLPLVFDTYQVCEERRAFFQDELASMGAPPFDLACFHREVPGDRL